MDKTLNLFVPGRLCLLGEHSDWAGKYRTTNNKINKGYAIVTGIEEGIYASVKISDKLIIKNTQNDKSFSCEMEEAELKRIASEGGYYSYVAGVAAAIKEHYDVSGVEINITKTTIPEKKGLSSSAAICVLVARAFNQLYHLHLNTIGEMNLAYVGEILTPSRCGRLDQACAFGKKPILMTFDGDKLDVEELKVGDNFYFVFADLMSKKDTIKILGDLNKCYPFAQTEVDEKVQKCLGEMNEQNIKRAVELLKEGNTSEFGKLMIKAQKEFDENVSIASPSELASPILHSVFNDKYIQENCYGYKGVGSQGDGTIQLLAKDYESQIKIQKYLKESLKMDSFTLTIEKTKKIKKAIIPLAGNGTRMYPITKLIKKSFLPIIDNDNLVKPVIMVLLEELYNAGIEEICLIIDKDDQKYYDNFFKNDLPEDVLSKMSPETLKYEKLIKEIGQRLTYVYQEEKLGLGHAVSLCKKFANNDNVLLVLGDQIYLSKNNKSCTEQLLENYEKNGKLTISVGEVDINDVSKYGILTGTLNKENNYFEVSKMTEKPDKDYANECLYTMCDNKKKYYSVFGEYILPPVTFEILDRNIKDKKTEKGEYQITSVLDEIRETEGMIAFIPNGEMLDVGNVNAYKYAFGRRNDKETTKC